MLLNIRARSSRDLSLRRARCHERISAPIAFIASGLTAGRNDTNCLPYLFLASRGRNSYPRNVNLLCSDERGGVRALAVPDALLVRLHLQTDLRQTISDRLPHVAGLALAGAVDHHVI